MNAIITTKNFFFFLFFQLEIQRIFHGEEALSFISFVYTSFVFRLWCQIQIGVKAENPSTQVRLFLFYLVVGG